VGAVVVVEVGVEGVVVAERGSEKVVGSWGLRLVQGALGASSLSTFPTQTTPLSSSGKCVFVLAAQERREAVLRWSLTRHVSRSFLAVPPSLPPSKTVNLQSLVEADTGAVGTKFYHLSNSALLIAAPLAFFLSPSILSFPLDLFLGVVFPLHAHIGFNYIISDYVPKASISLARYALMGVTGITILGLTKLNFEGPGLVESFKSVWREEKKK